ncbi:hypothetical protein QJS83_00270 [Bdellovibrio sp. 22V]|uniref:hypothetical protein n=1 Tax=Bdellovibrio TaxID=958 RepID=UPI002543A5DB|nr:hypothetical protein [Bdellovibrio sp. 22V]WII72300.1 hypothetical protein QJS83_00270 [Bdellovibrio sp. 22V]
MYGKSLLRTVIVSSIFAGSVAVAAKAKVDVYSEFQKKITKMESDLKKEKDADKRYDAFLQSYKELSDLRAKNPRQAEEKEINMSLFMDTLSYLPEKKDFKAAQCPEYKKEVNSMMKSYAKDQKEPFVEKAQGIVDLICK